MSHRKKPSTNQPTSDDIRLAEPCRLLTAKEVAGLLGCSQRAVYRWVAAGRLRPSSRTPGGRPRWTFRAIQAFLPPAEEA
jgi:excisionase family DNA binding protein